MNNFRWVTTLFNNRNPIMQMFGMGKSRRNTNWATLIVSIIALGTTAVFYGMRRENTNNQMQNSLQNMMNNVQGTVQKANVRPLRAGLAEFARELMPETKPKPNQTTVPNNQGVNSNVNATATTAPNTDLSDKQ